VVLKPRMDADQHGWKSVGSAWTGAVGQLFADEPRRLRSGMTFCVTRIRMLCGISRPR